jgi:hypothetical protein
VAITAQNGQKSWVSDLWGYGYELHRGAVDLAGCFTEEALTKISCRKPWGTWLQLIHREILWREALITKNVQKSAMGPMWDALWTKLWECGK